MLFDQFFAANARDRLGIYVNDHRAGSVAGHRAATRCANSNEGTELGTYLRDTFLVELESEQDHLDEVSEQLGIEPNHAKLMLALVASEAGRLKLNGQLTGYSPLSRIVELETLIGVVRMKRQLWSTLKHLDLDGIDAALMTELADQAGRQSDELQRHHGEALDEAFASTAA